MGVRKVKRSWWVDFQIHHRRYRYRSPSNTKAGADAYESLLRQKLVKGEDLNESMKSRGSTAISFEEYSTQWLKSYVAGENKPSEVTTKESTLRRHLVPWFGKMNLEEIGIPAIEKYKALKREEGLNPKSINNHLAILSRCLRSAEEWNLIKSVPRMKLLHVPPQNIDFLTPIESHRLLQDRQEPLWNEMTHLALRTGMRRGELTALDWADVDFERNQLTVRRSCVEGVIGSPKNNKIRHIPLTRDVREMLLARKGKQGLVFHRGDQKPLNKSVTGGAIIRVAKRAGLRRIGWHTLRHTFASCLASEGIPIPVIKELLGHSSIVMTMKYAHFSPSSMQNVVSVLEEAERREVMKECQPGVNREKEVSLV